MRISILAAIVLLGSAVLASPIPCDCDIVLEPIKEEPSRRADRSILKSCKDLKLIDGHTLEASCQNCEGAWNPASFNLDSVLGNNDGKFAWGSVNFSKSARETKLNSGTSELSGDLRRVNGQLVHGSTVLADRIQNDGGQLKFV
ncbi:hypothetical protein BGZ74_000756 [Mortierella antarctica]|nr:hypothetical protein BGZ74_000756 [Mortierella antarctica]